MNTTENNKLIAEFMEYDKQGEYFITAMGASLKLPSDFKFYSSWDSIMPVVAKIESLECVSYFTIDTYDIVVIARGDDEDFGIHNIYGDLSKRDYGTKIEAIYAACVEFIKWYNQQAGEK